MKRCLILCGLTLFCGLVNIPARDTEVHTPEVIYHLTQSTVIVKTKNGMGSGFALKDRPDLIITCAHVVEGSLWISVVFYDGTTEQVNPYLAYMDSDNDVAILKLPCQSKTGLAFGEGVIGEKVYVCGTPFTPILKNTITSGIISGYRIGMISGGNVQTDAPINPGVSGGPIINRRGEVVGMAQAYWRGSNGIGLGVSSWVIQEVLQTYLEIENGW